MSTAPKMSDISVIIPTLNEGGIIGALVENLKRQRNVEVIVADGGSSDATRAEAEAAGAMVVQSASGRGRQLNAGARLAAGEILIFLHADTRLPQEFASLAGAALHRPGTICGAFRFAVEDPAPRFRFVEKITNWRGEYLGLPYGDQALFMTAAMFQELGGFREIPLLEDVDLVRRARRRGQIAIADAPALTSARRWRQLGIVRTTLINQLILLGYLAGLSPFRLARWYGKIR